MSPWETVREDYIILQRYDLSIAELEKLNWTIYYPPTEAMKDFPDFDNASPYTIVSWGEALQQRFDVLLLRCRE